VLQSETLRHAEQLRQLLGYLGEKSLAGEASGLKEYTVGLEALNKGAEYDPRKDATVRIQVGRLRTKLDEYARGEGAGDPLEVVLPKGAFRLEFRGRHETTGEVAAPKEWRGWRWVAAAMGLAAMLTTLGWWLAEDRKPTTWTQEMRGLWGDFLAPEKPLLLSLGSSLFYYADGMVVRDWAVNREEDGRASAKLNRVREALGGVALQPMSVYTGYGEAAAAVALTQLFEREGKELSFRRGEAFAWEDFKGKNVILVGAPKNLARLQELNEMLGGLKLVVENTGVINRSPSPGEPEVFRGSRDHSAQVSRVVAVVTKVPSLDRSGAMLLLLAPDTEGVLAAAEAVTSPVIARELSQRVKGKAAFQVLLEAQVRKNVPIQTRVVAVKELE
jgi:hypothetical protein